MFYILPFIISFSLCLIFMPLFINLGVKKGFCDDPKKDKLKVHKKPIPYVGGLAIFCATNLSLLTALILSSDYLLKIIALLVGGILVCALGFWDDWRWAERIKGLVGKKILWQIIVSFLIIFILFIAGWRWQFLPGIWLWAFSLIYLVGNLNATNVIDGLDGLAGGIAAISAIGFSIVSFWREDQLALILSLAVLGAVIGFLIYNFNPASIFMGDNGSYFLGFMMIALAINFTSQAYSFKLLIFPILIIGLPVFNQIFVIVKRLSQGLSPFRARRDHLYDDLLKRYGSVKRTVVICYLIQIIFIISGLFLAY